MAKYKTAASGKMKITIIEFAKNLDGFGHFTTQDNELYYIEQSELCGNKTFGEIFDNPFQIVSSYAFLYFLIRAFNDFFVKNPNASTKSKKEKLIDPYSFSPFQKVLVRDNDEDIWQIDLFSSYCKTRGLRYGCLNSLWKQCIPYKGNDHLLGTTISPDQ